MAKYPLEWTDFYDESVSPVSKAASAGKLNEVEQLLEDDPDVDYRDNRGWIAVHHAAAVDADNVLKFLLGYDPELIDDQTYDGETPLMLAVAHGSMFCFQSLLSRKDLDINQKDEEGNTALWYAMDRVLDRSGYYRRPLLDEDERLCHIEVVEDLLQAGADVNVKDDNDEKFLRRLARGSEEIVPDLIRLVLPLTVFDADERMAECSPLQEAVKMNLNSVEVFLEFTNQSEYVVPNRGCVEDALNFTVRDETVVMSDLALLLASNAPDEQVLNIARQMIQKGWQVNVDDSFSLLASLAISRVKYCKLSDDSFEAIVELLASKNSIVKPSEARLLVEEILFKNHGSSLTDLTNSGIIPAEMLLQVVPDVRAEQRERNVEVVMTPRMAFVLIINDAFGYQGRHASKIDQALEVFGESFGGTRNAVVRRNLEVGTLKKQVRSLIRQRLMAKGAFHPWQMIELLKPCIPISTLIDFVANTRISKSN